MQEDLNSFLKRKALDWSREVMLFTTGVVVGDIKDDGDKVIVTISLNKNNEGDNVKT